MIINEVGTHADVKALVFVAAFEPDVGESVADLSDKMPAAAKSVGPVGDGFLAVDPDAFAADFAADAPKPVARFMAISQVPVAAARDDCVAGHVRLELRNVGAKYPFERSPRFPGIQPNSGHRDYSRLSCGGGNAARGARDVGGALQHPLPDKLLAAADEVIE